MPLMVLNRNLYVRTTTPFSPAFKKGVPTDVHPLCVEAALGVGAVMADGSDAIPETVEKAVAVPTGEDRKKQMFAAFEKLTLRNQRGDFNASGLPDLRKLNPMVGFEIDIRERNEVWEEYMASTSKAEE